MARKHRIHENNPDFTAHAQERIQQRGFSQSHINIVTEFGKRKVRKKAYVYFMDKGARAKAERAMGRGAYRRVEDKLGIYVVKSFSGRIITVAHRNQRLKW